MVDTAIHTSHRWPRFLPDGTRFIYLAVSHFRDASHNGIFFGSLERKDNRFVVSTDADATYASGYLFFFRNDTLVAQRFDPRSGQLQGEVHRTPERVLYDPTIWKVVFDASERSVMAYQLGTRVSGNPFYWFDRSGKEIGSLGEPTFQFEPSISRDGRRMAVGVANGGYSNLWVYDLDRGGRMQITFTRYDNTTPVWSPDGRRIFFAGKRQHYSLYQVDANGVMPEKLILDLGNDAWPAAVSPDGRFLLFCQGVNIARSRSQLWAYPLNGKGKPFRVVNDEAIVTEGQFSPDGHWIAYTSNESGRPEVYIQSFPQSGGQWQISTGGGAQPRWRKDGKELFYVGVDRKMMAIDLALGSTVEPGTAKPLFQTQVQRFEAPNRYAVSGDGQRFLINSPVEEVSQTPITVVLNWTAGLKRQQ